MDICDVLIVGGGPAGSSCARELCRAGLDVVVLDKAVFPRDKVCAGWITPAVIAELEIDVDDYSGNRTLQPITGFRTSLLGAGDVETSFGHPVSFGIRRCEFDDYLLKRAGARLRLGTPLDSLRRDGERWIANDMIAAPLVIGAGGHFCPVARLTTEKSSDDEVVVVAQEIEFEMNADQRGACRVKEETPELFFCDDLLGYGWCFRKGNFLNIGLGRAGDPRLSAQVESFFHWLTERGRIPSGITPRFHGHAYRLHLGSPRRMRADRVLLIGDSAGLAYAQSGEGIRPAVESGLLAAETILETPRDRRLELADRLQKKLLARFGPPGRRNGAGALIPDAWRKFAARRLMASKWFSRRVLIERWFLHLDQPPLDVSASRRLRTEMAS